MANNNDIKLHVSMEERVRWDKVVADFAKHLGSSGVANHALGDGSIPGFSTNDFTNVQKNKLAGIEDGALNNPHPATHPYTMITGLHQVSWTGNYHHLNNIPLTFIAGGGNSDTVGGIRITINVGAPANPKNNQEIWVNPSTCIMYIYTANQWIPLKAAFA